jgi:hypothetical protein
MNVLGEFRDYNGLHLILRKRADELSLSRTSIDDLAGLQDGYSSKLLAPNPGKRLGPLTIGLLLPALGMKLVAVEDEEALVKIRSRTSPRNEKAVRMLAVYAGRGKHLISKRFLRSIAPLGARGYMRKVSPERRRWIARNAARARWQQRAAALRG